MGIDTFDTSEEDEKGKSTARREEEIEIKKRLTPEETKRKITQEPANLKTGMKDNGSGIFMHEDKQNCTGGTIGWTEKERTQESRPPTAQSLGRGSACLPPQICGTLPRIESRGTPRGSSMEGTRGRESSTLCSGGGSESLSTQMGTLGRVASRGTERRSTTGCTWGEGGPSLRPSWGRGVEACLTISVAHCQVWEAGGKQGQALWRSQGGRDVQQGVHQEGGGAWRAGIHRGGPLQGLQGARQVQA